MRLQPDVPTYWSARERTRPQQQRRRVNCTGRNDEPFRLDGQRRYDAARRRISKDGVESGRPKPRVARLPFEFGCFALCLHGEIAGLERYRQKAVDHRPLQVEPASEVTQPGPSAALGVPLDELEAFGAAEDGCHFAHDGIAAVLLRRFLAGEGHDARHLPVMRFQRTCVDTGHAGDAGPLVEDEGWRHHPDRTPEDAAASQDVTLVQRNACALCHIEPAKPHRHLQNPEVQLVSRSERAPFDQEHAPTGFGKRRRCNRPSGTRPDNARIPHRASDFVDSSMNGSCARILARSCGS